MIVYNITLIHCRNSACSDSLLSEMRCWTLVGTFVLGGFRSSAIARFAR